MSFAANKQIRHSKAVFVVTSFVAKVCANLGNKRTKGLEPTFVICLIQESNMLLHWPLKYGHWRWLLSQSVVCLTCRQVSDTAPEQCPSCNQATFVQFSGKEDPNSLCEELLFVAALVRMGFDQSQLSRSAVPRMPAGSLKNGKTARVGASAGQSNRKYRVA